MGRKGPTVQLDRPVPPPGSAGEDRGDRRCSEQAGASPHRRRSWRRSPSDPGSGSSRPTPARPPAGARPWPAPHPEEPEVPLQLQRSGCSAKRKEWIWLGQRLTIQPAYITHTVSTDVTMPLGHRPQVDRQAGVADSSSPWHPGGCGRSRSHRPDQEPSPPGSAPVSFAGFCPDGGSQALGRRCNAGAAGWLRAPRSRTRGIGRWRGGRGLRSQLWGCDAGQFPACGQGLG
jgi:hypothetical protein